MPNHRFGVGEFCVEMDHWGPICQINRDIEFQCDIRVLVSSSPAGKYQAAEFWVTGELRGMEQAVELKHELVWEDPNKNLIYNESQVHP